MRNCCPCIVRAPVDSLITVSTLVALHVKLIGGEAELIEVADVVLSAALVEIRLGIA